MGIVYSIDADARLVRLNYVGEVGIDEFRTTMTAIFRASSYRPGFGFLSDRRDAPASTTEYLHGTVAFAAAHQKELAGSRWATVVSIPVNYGLSRMAQNLLEGQERYPMLRVFTDISQAEAWLREPAPEE
jgi:hypothetical protein